MPSVVILNDTAGRNHHGCARVMRLLVAGLERAGLTVAARAPAHQDWAARPDVLSALAAADLVVVNGEGTLHSGRPGAERLLQVTRHPAAAGKPVAVVNALWTGNPPDWGIYLADCALLAARDSASAQAMAAASGRPVRWLPDLSLSAPAGVPALPRRGLIVGDSVRLSARRALARAAAQRPDATFLPTKTLRWPLLSAPLLGRLARHAVYRAYMGHAGGGVPRVELAPDEPAYLRRLAAAELHLTGRFHAVCLSMLTETPFLAIAANTSKIERLLADAGLGPRRLLPPEALDMLPDSAPFDDAELAAIRAFRDTAAAEAERLCADLRALT